MNPESKQAYIWTCSRCKRVFEGNARGRAQASFCCTCSGCSGTEHLEQGHTLCLLCILKRGTQEALSQKKTAEKALETLHKLATKKGLVIHWRDWPSREVTVVVPAVKPKAPAKKKRK